MKRIQLILILAMIHGLIYVFIIPPWQHYDEPGHFEYSWLIANRLKLPQVGDYDQDMRLSVGKSLIDSSFFAAGKQPNLTDPSKPIWIGISQLIDPPLYYVIDAIPLLVLKGAAIDFQLYGGRIVSLLFLLLTVFCAYKITQELTPTDHPLQWMVPLFISALPAFVEFMTSINDFVAAIAIFSLWLFVSVKLIKGFSFKYAGLLFLLTLACILTQKILYPVIAYLPIVFLLSIIPGKFKYLAWISTAIISFLVILLVFRWGDAAFWLRTNNQDIPSRASIQENLNDSYILQGKVYPDSSWGNIYPSRNPGFFQLVPSDISSQLQGKTVTIGAWVWSTRNITGYGPGLNSLLQVQDRWFGFKRVKLSNEPLFIASVVQLPEHQERLQIWLRTTAEESQDVTIYFSGIILVEGAWSVDTPPLLIDKEGSKGIWGSQTFTNLVRNPQFQQAWPYMEANLFQIISNKIQELKPVHISSFLSLFLDIPGTKWYTASTGQVIFQTFWARFCWGQVPLITVPPLFYPYQILSFITLMGFIGTLLTGFRLFKRYKHEYLFLLVIIGATLLVALFYGVFIMGGALRYRAFIPTARYIFPAIIPISLILVLGWQGISAWVTKLSKIPPKLMTILYWGFLIGLDLFSIASVLVYFTKS